MVAAAAVVVDVVVVDVVVVVDGVEVDAAFDHEEDWGACSRRCRREYPSYRDDDDATRCRSFSEVTNRDDSLSAVANRG